MTSLCQFAVTFPCELKDETVTNQEKQSRLSKSTWKSIRVAWQMQMDVEMEVGFILLIHIWDQTFGHRFCSLLGCRLLIAYVAGCCPENVFKTLDPGIPLP